MCPSLIKIGSKTAEKNSAQTNRQTDRQTDRHYENNGHLAVNQKCLHIKQCTHDKWRSTPQIILMFHKLRSADYALCICHIQQGYRPSGILQTLASAYNYQKVD